MSILWGKKTVIAITMLAIAVSLLSPFMAQTVLAQGGGADSGQAGERLNFGGDIGNVDVTGPSRPLGFGDGIGGVSGGGNGGIFDVTGDGSADSLTGPFPVNPLGFSQNVPSVNETAPVSFEKVQEASNANNNKGFYYSMLSIGGVITGIGGNIFDIAFRQAVVEFGCWFVADGRSGCTGDGTVGGVVDNLWKVIRDLFNIVFIFSLVYIGLRLILFSDDSSTKKAIGGLIGAALLVNFSLYIAKLIVDISNYTALQIYGALTGGISGQFGTGVFELAGDGSVAGTFMEVLKITSWFGTDVKDESTLTSSIVLGILTFIFLCYLGFIFLYGAIMLMARFIALVILLIFSPIMFLGWVLPQFKSYSSKWTAAFLGYSFYIPVYVFLLYMSLFVLIQISSWTEGKPGYADSINVASEKIQPDNFIIFYVFFLGMGFLYASTKVASAMSKAGAGATMNLAGNFAGKISGYVPKKIGSGIGSGIGLGAGYLASKTTGQLGTDFKNWSESIERKKGRSTVISRSLAGAAASAQSKKFLGSASAKERAETISAGNRRAAGLKNQSDAKATLERAGASDIEKQRAISKLDKSEIIAMSKTAAGAKILTDNAKFLTADHIKALSEDKEKDAGAVSSIISARGASVTEKLRTTAFKDLTSDDLAAMNYDKLIDPEYAIQLSDDKIKGLPLVEAEKNDLKKARKDAYKHVIHDGATVGPVTMDKVLKLDADKLADLPDDVFKTSSTTDPAKQMRIRSFVQQLPLNALAKIENKRGSDVAQEIRNELTAFAGTTPPTGSRQADIDDWLRNNNIGKNFGK